MQGDDARVFIDYLFEFIRYLKELIKMNTHLKMKK